MQQSPALVYEHSSLLPLTSKHRAADSLGYRLSPQALSILVKRYSTDGRIAFDDFVACCIRLRSLTGTVIHKQCNLDSQVIFPSDSFRKRDTAQQGVASFGYDDVSFLILQNCNVFYLIYNL